MMGQKGALNSLLGVVLSTSVGGAATDGSSQGLSGASQHFPHDLPQQQYT